MKIGRNITRRDFLRTGTAALAGAAHLASGACSPSPQNKAPGSGKFVRRTLGRTGLELPLVSIGSAYAANLVQSALDAGFVYIHTSGGYGEGKHERMLSQVVRDRPRDSYVIGSSPDLPYRFDRRNGRSSGLGREADPTRISTSLHDSLQRLGLDHIDIYYLGSISSPETLVHEPYQKALAQLKASGLIRFAGIATHENEPAVIRAAAKSGFWDVVLTAYNFRQAHREEVKAAIAEAAAAGVGIVAMKTQAGVYWDRLRTRKINMKAALKWVLQDPNVHTTIPAFSTFAEMQEDLEVMADPSLTPQEARDLALGEEHGYRGHYCQQCGTCLAQCPAGMDIPTLMRSYMYAFGHEEPRQARTTLRGWTAAQVACLNCESCEVSCAQKFDVRGRALDIARILTIPEEFLG